MTHAIAGTRGTMSRLADLGVPWWNDSCDLRHLSEAVAAGAVGATSNPVIVAAAVADDQARWLPVIERLIVDMPHATEDEIAWALVKEMGRHASAILQPVFEATGGRDGCLCLQVNPKYFRNADRMHEHGRELAMVAPNVAIKVPATAAGLEAVERLATDGVRVNVTVSFTVSQALAAAEAIERGLKRSTSAAASRSYVTLMIGRVDDHLKRVNEAQNLGLNDAALNMAGIAVFKRAAGMFAERGYSSVLLAAAYRYKGHFSEIIGGDVIQSMPYAFWKQCDAATIESRLTLTDPVEPDVLTTLMKVDDFNLAYEPTAMRPEAFASYGAAKHTLNQFLAGYDTLLHIVRKRMLE